MCEVWGVFVADNEEIDSVACVYAAVWSCKCVTKEIKDVVMMGVSSIRSEAGKCSTSISEKSSVTPDAEW